MIVKINKEDHEDHYEDYENHEHHEDHFVLLCFWICLNEKSP